MLIDHLFNVQNETNTFARCVVQGLLWGRARHARMDKMYLFYSLGKQFMRQGRVKDISAVKDR